MQKNARAIEVFGKSKVKPLAPNLTITKVYKPSSTLCCADGSSMRDWLTGLFTQIGKSVLRDMTAMLAVP